MHTMHIAGIQEGVRGRIGPAFNAGRFEEILERFQEKLIVVYDRDCGFLLGLHQASDNIEPVIRHFVDIGTPYKSQASVEIKNTSFFKMWTGPFVRLPTSLMPMEARATIY